MQDLEIFFLIIFCGLFVESVFYFVLKYLFGKHFRNHLNPKFVSISIFFIPIWGLLFFITRQNLGYIKIFLIFAFIGTLAESLLGRFFFDLIGKKVWSYNFAKLGRFTSWISIPYWGWAGLLFFWIAKFYDN